MSYSQYRGQCIGRVCYFLSKYCGSYIADEVCIENNIVKFNGSIFATYTWLTLFGMSDVPEFKFLNNNFQFLNENNKTYEEIQKKDWKEVCQAATDFFQMELCEEVSVDFLLATIPEAHREMDVHRFSNEKLKYYVGKTYFNKSRYKENILFADLIGPYGKEFAYKKQTRYFWDKKAKVWLFDGELKVRI